MADKKKKYVYYTISFLGVLLVLLILFGRDDIEERRELLATKTINFTINQETTSLSLDDITQMDNMTINTILRSSAAAPREVSFIGLPLGKVLETVDADVFSAGNTVVLRAIDGYSVALSAAEVQQENNVFLIYADAKTNQYLAPQDEGGDGPFMTIVAQDQFGQRWVKYLIEVIVQ